VDHSEVYFVEATIRLAQAFWRALPFKLQRYGGAYLMAQLPAVRAVLSGPQWQAFQQQVLQPARGHGEAAHAALGAEGAPPGLHPAAPGQQRGHAVCNGAAHQLAAAGGAAAAGAATGRGCSRQRSHASGGHCRAVTQQAQHSPGRAIPKLYSDKVATVQEACQEYWWVPASCMVLVLVMDSCRQLLLMLRLNTCRTTIHVHSL
jgi:hypothetical protein